MQTIWKVASAVAVQLMVFSRPALPADVGRGDLEEAYHDYHRNIVELFLGAAYEDDEHGFTAGATYERRLSKLLGLGGFYEYATGDFDKWSIGAPLFIHPHEGWRFALAPGLEHGRGDDEFLFRTGVAYEFELSERWVMLPELNVDFVDGEEAFVFGLSLGFGLES